MSDTKPPSDPYDDDDTIVTYNSNAWYLWFLAITFVFSIIASGIFSAKFSNLLHHHGAKMTPKMSELAAEINDLSICNWFFVTVPGINVGLTGGLWHKVSKLSKMLQPAAKAAKASAKAAAKAGGIPVHLA